MKCRNCTPVKGGPTWSKKYDLIIFMEKKQIPLPFTIVYGADV